MKVERSDFGYHLILRQGEDIEGSFLTFAREYHPPSCYVIGMGSVRDLVLGYYDVIVDQVVERRFPTDMELVSFTGNLTYLNEQPVLHAHAAAADRDFNVVGGHFLGGTINVTGEFAVILDKIRVQREQPGGKPFSYIKFV